MTASVSGSQPDHHDRKATTSSLAANRTAKVHFHSFFSLNVHLTLTSSPQYPILDV
jgi:hypothetical protein